MLPERLQPLSIQYTKHLQFDHTRISTASAPIPSIIQVSTIVRIEAAFFFFAVVDAAGATKVVEGTEVLVELALELEVVFKAELVLDVEVAPEVDDALLVRGPVRNGTVVAPLTTTIVVPSITVVLP
jgi:hypothetical protein